MSANPEANRVTDDLFEGEDRREHSPEPWRQEGRYLRDATGAIVVRGRSSADARRIAAAINGVRGIPTEVLESWKVEDVSDPATRPDFEVEVEVELGEEFASPHEVRPPSADLARPSCPFLSARRDFRSRRPSPTTAAWRSAGRPSGGRRTGGRASSRSRAPLQRRSCLHLGRWVLGVRSA